MATEEDTIDTSALGTIVAVGTAATLGIALGVNALVRHESDARAAERDPSAQIDQRNQRAAQEGKLSAPAAWSDRAKGQVSLPIERAMELVVGDLKRDPWSASPPPPLDAGADAEPTDAATETADAAAETPDAGVAASDAGIDAAPAETSDAAADSRGGTP